MKAITLRFERWLVWRTMRVVRVLWLPFAWRMRFVAWGWARVHSLSTRIARVTGQCAICGRSDSYLDRNGDCFACVRDNLGDLP